MQRSRTALVAAAVLVVTGCAQSPSDGCGAGAVDGVSVSGAFGEAPEVTIASPLTVASTGFAVLIHGDGERVEAGDVAHTEYTVYNATTGTEIEHTNYAVDEWAPLYVAGTSLLPGLRPAFECATVGSRIVVALAPGDGYGEPGRPDLGVGAEDTVVFVLDIDDVTKAADIPEE